MYDTLISDFEKEGLPFTEPNDYFMGLDSRALVAMLCSLKPDRIIEVGSGFSTLLMAGVNRHLLGSRALITSVDPFASDVIRGGFPGHQRLLERPIQEVELSEFKRLKRNDVLFVDSSHVLKTGSDVEFLLCRVLPNLTAGVVIHFHDVYLPHDYPYEWVVEQRRDWNEQYALKAIIANSDRYEMMFGSRYAHESLRSELSIALGPEVSNGQSLWLRVRVHDEARPRGGQRQRTTVPAVAYDPALVPPLDLMQSEGIDVLEEWFRWGEEWSMLLRVYGELKRSSRVLEIGCGLGRTAFPLRFLIDNEGSYDGFDITRAKIDFLQQFQAQYPRFRFQYVDLHNTQYNPAGAISPSSFRFPYEAEAFDLVYAASVFTHLLAGHAAHYFKEIARVLAPGGRAVISAFLLDNYDPDRARPHAFARPAFNFDHPHGGLEGFAVADPKNPEMMTAYSLALFNVFAEEAGMTLARSPVPGIWSGAHEVAVGAQDVVVYVRR